MKDLLSEMKILILLNHFEKWKLDNAIIDILQTVKSVSNTIRWVDQGRWGPSMNEEIKTTERKIYKFWSMHSDSWKWTIMKIKESLEQVFLKEIIHTIVGSKFFPL